MNTATATPATDLADRFQCEAGVPDPPPDAAGRKQYWEDTVAEAVAELRRRLASSRDEKSFQALEMIVDLEKTRLRHKEPVAGTEVEGRWSPGLGSLADSTSSGGKYQGRKKEDLAPPALASRDREDVAGVPGEPGPPGPRVVRNQETHGPGGPGSPSQTTAPTRRVGRQQNGDVLLNAPSPERDRGVGSSPVEPFLSYPFPPKPSNDTERSESR